LECNEGIFNPICPVCIAKQICVWSEDNGFEKKLKRKIKRFTDSIKNRFTDEGVDCAICKNHQTSICPYCFTNKIYSFLQKLGVKRKILEEFLVYFNYDFEHTGYSKDFEEDFKNG
jgi:hypothetical protein